jgi:hypothetical protein
LLERYLILAAVVLGSSLPAVAHHLDHPAEIAGALSAPQDASAWAMTDVRHFGQRRWRRP